ncbi:hypothetical protein E5Q_03465 [Mixia osmundae IAM 14324]|uniref:Uncharacterized protein n=1 Tax=Mixia osmundae (strain CBS 9802 / IAM 14324 / JCM 22182 / KY 12970) TaxID=764103 RepID=G7E1T3_MIXOS|nr:hypothetical protein E5Q_03465 [Mixia osmundae IAM 14324]
MTRTNDLTTLDTDTNATTLPIAAMHRHTRSGSGRFLPTFRANAEPPGDSRIRSAPSETHHTGKGLLPSARPPKSPEKQVRPPARLQKRPTPVSSRAATPSRPSASSSSVNRQRSRSCLLNPEGIPIPPRDQSADNWPKQAGPWSPRTERSRDDQIGRAAPSPASFTGSSTASSDSSIRRRPITACDSIQALSSAGSCLSHHFGTRPASSLALQHTAISAPSQDEPVPVHRAELNRSSPPSQPHKRVSARLSNFKRSLSGFASAKSPGKKDSLQQLEQKWHARELDFARSLDSAIDIATSGPCLLEASLQLDQSTDDSADVKEAHSPRLDGQLQLPTTSEPVIRPNCVSFHSSTGNALGLYVHAKRAGEHRSICRKAISFETLVPATSRSSRLGPARDLPAEHGAAEEMAPSADQRPQSPGGSNRSRFGLSSLFMVNLPPEAATGHLVPTFVRAPSSRAGPRSPKMTHNGSRSSLNALPSTSSQSSFLDEGSPINAPLRSFYSHSRSLSTAGRDTSPRHESAPMSTSQTAPVRPLPHHSSSSDLSEERTRELRRQPMSPRIESPPSRQRSLSFKSANQSTSSFTALEDSNGNEGRPANDRRMSLNSMLKSDHIEATASNSRPSIATDSTVTGKASQAKTIRAKVKQDALSSLLREAHLAVDAGGRKGSSQKQRSLPSSASGSQIMSPDILSPVSANGRHGYADSFLTEKLFEDSSAYSLTVEIWQPSVAGSGKERGGLLSFKTPLLRDVPAVRRKKRESAHLSESEIRMSNGGIAGSPTGDTLHQYAPRPSRFMFDNGSWAPSQLAIRDSKLLLFGEDRVMLHYIDLASLTHSNVRTLDPTALQRPYALSIRKESVDNAHGFSAIASSVQGRAAPGTFRSSGSHPNSLSEIGRSPSSTAPAITVYVSFASPVALQITLAMLRCHARPEIYPFLPRLDSLQDAPSESPAATTDAQDSEIDRVRLWRRLDICVVEAKDLGDALQGPKARPFAPVGALKRAEARPSSQLSDHSSDRELSQGGPQSATSGRFNDIAPPRQSQDFRESHQAELEAFAATLSVHCELVLDGDILARTTVKKGTEAPFWREVYRIDDLGLLQQPLTVNIVQTAKTGKAHIMGSVTIPAFDLRTSKEERWYPIVTDDGKRMFQSGELSVSTRLTELVVLPAEEYDELRAFLLAPQNTSLLYDIANASDQLDAMAASLLRISLANDLCLTRLMQMADREIDGREETSSILFRGNTLFTKMLEMYMRLIGQDLLETSLGPLVRRICRDDIDIEIDPARLRKDKAVQEGVKSLHSWAVKLWTSIYDSRQTCPSDLRGIFHYIQGVVNIRYDKSKRSMRFTCISAFVFLRFFVPAILNPRLFGLVYTTPGLKAQRTLTLLAKTLQGLANMSQFGQKEPWMSVMNPFLDSSAWTYSDYITNIAGLAPDYQPEWTSKECQLYRTPRDLQARLSGLAAESIPSLPHLIDPPKEFAYIANCIGPLRDARGKAEERSATFQRFTQICADLTLKSRARSRRIARSSRRFEFLEQASISALLSHASDSSMARGSPPTAPPRRASLRESPAGELHVLLGEPPRGPGASRSLITAPRRSRRSTHSDRTRLSEDEGQPGQPVSVPVEPLAWRSEFASFSFGRTSVEGDRAIMSPVDSNPQHNSPRTVASGFVHGATH